MDFIFKVKIIKDVSASNIFCRIFIMRSLRIRSPNDKIDLE